MTEIAEGAITDKTHRAIAENELIEKKVQVCATDLNEVNEELASGVSDLKQTEAILIGYKIALANSEDALERSRLAERAAQIQSLHDEKTGLPNRALFDDRIAKAIASVDRDGGTLAVLFFDLDRFKNINDRHGHAVGDHVLKEVSLRLSAHCRDMDTLCRNGGDEFLYLLINPGRSKNIEHIIDFVLSDLSAPIQIDAEQIVISTSVGISIYPDDGDHGDVLVRKADQAMYQAKRDSGRFRFYSNNT
jgi:diguanylate cyclase (GGDEF)-like protein